MIGGPSINVWAAAVLGVILVVAIARLWRWNQTAPVEARATPVRLAWLVGLQIAAAVLLYLTLFPPAVVLRAGTLVVAGEGALARMATAPGDILVAVPEAGPVEGARRVPDLATALRRFPGVARIRVEGSGLTPRDLGPLPVPLEFRPPPLPRGLLDITLPDPVAPGAEVAVGAQTGRLTAGMLELIDPAGVVVDRARVAANQRAVLTANARAPGLALFELRLRDAGGGLVERIAVPVETRAQVQPRVLVLAGAPNAETNYLRRWAEDAGIDLDVQIDLGGGVQLGDAPPALTAAGLAEIDLVVIDDRRWDTLGAGPRSALAAAVNAGLGLLLRPTGPLSGATRRDWAALGLPLSGQGDARPLRLPGDAAPQVAAAPPADASGPPDLARRDFRQEGPRAVSVLRGADGADLASWRARGRGRVGLWTVADSYVLVLTGRPDLYGEMWSQLFSALARAGDDTRMQIDGLVRSGSRAVLCGIIGEATVDGPDGVRPLRVDPAGGDRACAAYWPQRSGWHVARDGRGRETSFYVHSADAAPSLALFETRQATMALAAGGPDAIRVRPGSTTSGSPWPWFSGLLAALAGLWWLERNRRRPTPEP